MSSQKAQRAENQPHSVRNDDLTSSDVPPQLFAVIEPTRSLFKLELKELWDYRELLYFLAWRDVKVRYKQTALGVLWAILQPLLAMLVFTLLFSQLEGLTAGSLPYPLFAYSGLVLWMFFANSVNYTANSLVGNTSLLTKVYFPRIIIPTSAVFACALDLLISCWLLVPLSLWYGVNFSTSALMAPVLVMLLIILAIGVGLFTSALCVKYRDVRYALPFGVQLLMFVSSVITPPSLIPEKFRGLFVLNPLTGIVENFRAVTFGHPINWTSLIAAVALTMLVFSGALLYFRRVEQSFADIV